MRDSLFHIQKTDFTSLQAQIRQTLVSAILDGQLDDEEPLPSTRKMAKILGVSRNTVVLAYQSLLDDGYLMSRERSGYYVNGQMRDAARNETLGAAEPAEDASTDTLEWTHRFRVRPSKQENISKPLDWQSYPYPFIYGQVDHELFPITEWRECSRQALGKRWFGAWTNDIWESDDPLLVEQIRKRLLPRRGIRANDDQILITLGAQNALYILASLLVSPSTRVAIEEPGYTDVRNIFALKTDRIEALTVDEKGLPVDERLDACDVAFVTPSHQFPTTATMPIERRKSLLEKAQEKDILIIEDDYEFETNYVNEPCPALKSLDTHERVIYVGSLSKTLFPGLRLGYIVGAPELIREARTLRRLMVRHAPNNNQRTAALFLSLGHHDSLVRRLHRVYRQRWEIISAAARTYFPESAAAPSFGGTSIWVKAPRGVDSDELGREAAEKGILIEPGRIHFIAPEDPCRWFRLGFSSIRPEKIEPGIKLLSEIAYKLAK
ncbi:MAG: PLP-dependent aminotransferase family protein [Hyphomicrobiales bacterium]